MLIILETPKKFQNILNRKSVQKNMPEVGFEPTLPEKFEVLRTPY